MDKRTTFSLDEQTIIRLKKLAPVWHVSQAEVVRRAVELAENEVDRHKNNKIETLFRYLEKKALKAEKADAYLGEVVENWSDWGRDR